MFNFSRFKFITFDCYGTLIDWETGILTALHRILEPHSVRRSDGEILGVYADLETQAEAGDFKPYREVLREVVRGMGERYGFQATASEQEMLPASLAAWRPFPDTVNALRRLHSRFQLAIISNIDNELFAASASQLGINFDHVITAFEARAYKPSPTIFRLAQQKLGISTAEWLHVGQSIYHDVIPAKSLGITTLWVNRPSHRPGVGAVPRAAGAPDLEIASLRELEELAFLEA